MRKPKKIVVQIAVAAIVAGVCALVGVLLIVNVLSVTNNTAQTQVAKALEEAQKAKQALEKLEAEKHALRQEMRMEVHAATTIEPDTLITADLVSLVSVPAMSAATGGLQSIEEAVGKISRVKLLAGETIRVSQVFSWDSPEAIRSGYRAMSLELSTVASLNGYLRPGNHVDVLASFQVGDTRVVKTLLQNVPVLSFGLAGKAPATTFGSGSAASTSSSTTKKGGKSAGQGDVKPSPGGIFNPTSSPAITPIASSPSGQPGTQIITLMVKPLEAERLALAMQASSLHLTLRHPVDQEQGAMQGQTLATVLKGLTPEKPAPPKVVVKAPAPAKPLTFDKAPPPPMPVYAVEVIKGGSSEVRSFQLEDVHAR
jgi:Flp pilus assembly protein CpaB